MERGWEHGLLASWYVSPLQIKDAVSERKAGPFVHSLEVSQLKNCADEVRQDRLNFGIDCVKKLVKYQEVVIEHATDIARLKHEAASFKESVDKQGDSDVFVVTNATLLTMATGNAEDDLIHDAVLVTRGGVIEYAGPASENYPIPAHANSINAQGGWWPMIQALPFS